jgi:hypothetical protein
LKFPTRQTEIAPKQPTPTTNKQTNNNTEQKQPTPTTNKQTNNNTEQKECHGVT